MIIKIHYQSDRRKIRSWFWSSDDGSKTVFSLFGMLNLDEHEWREFIGAFLIGADSKGLKVILEETEALSIN